MTTKICLQNSNPRLLDELPFTSICPGSGCISLCMSINSSRMRKIDKRSNVYVWILLNFRACANLEESNIYFYLIHHIQGNVATKPDNILHLKVKQKVFQQNKYFRTGKSSHLWKGRGHLEIIFFSWPAVFS